MIITHRYYVVLEYLFFFFQAEDGIRDQRHGDRGSVALPVAGGVQDLAGDVDGRLRGGGGAGDGRLVRRPAPPAAGRDEPGGAAAPQPVPVGLDDGRGPGRQDRREGADDGAAVHVHRLGGGAALRGRSGAEHVEVVFGAPGLGGGDDRQGDLPSGGHAAPRHDLADAGHRGGEGILNVPVFGE